MQSQSQPKHKKPKPKSPHAKSIGAKAKAPTSKALAAGKRWSVGASWDGFGVKAGLDINSRSVESNPNFQSKNSGPIFSHSEVVATLTSPSATHQSISVAHTFQPGSSDNFPWLSNVAKGFQQYRVLSARYRYIPFTSVFGAAGAQGRVSLFFDYQVTSPVDANIDDMLNKAPSLNTQSADACVLQLNPKFMVDNNRRTRFLRTDDQVTTTNLGEYDGGKLIVALDEFAAPASFGKIMCEYTVEFLIPASQKVTGISPNAFIDAYKTTYAFADASGTMSRLNRSWEPDGPNAGNVHLDDDGTGVQSFRFESGTYLMILQVKTPLGVANALYGYRNYFEFTGTGNAYDSADLLAIGGSATKSVLVAETNNVLSVLPTHATVMVPLFGLYYSGALASNALDVRIVFLASA